jgi:hypothetical protein
MATWFLRNFSFRDKICPEEYFWAYLGSFCSLNGTDCVSGHENSQLFLILERFICECWFVANLLWDSIFHTPNNVKFPLNSHEGVCWNSTIMKIKNIFQRNFIDCLIPVLWRRNPRRQLHPGVLEERTSYRRSLRHSRISTNDFVRI